MTTAAQRSGCLAGGRRDKPKHEYPTREDGQRGLEWMVQNLGAPREVLRVYQCRYSSDADPHFHVGHKPGETRKQYGRRDDPRRQRR